MKAMFGLITIGVLSLLVTLYIAFKHFDGVIEDKTFEASLVYDENKNFSDNISSNIKNIKIIKDNGIIKIYADIPKGLKPLKVLLSQPTKKPTELNYIDNYYQTEKILNKGWYNIQFIYINNNFPVFINRSIYLD